jgi:hypothetical protein
MQIEKKLLTGKMNSDDSDHKLPQEDYRDALNVRIMDSTDGDGGAVSTIKGNVKVAEVGTDNGKVCIGTVEDLASRSIIKFFYKRPEVGTATHCIYQYFIETGESVKLVDWVGLRFDVNNPIHASVIEDRLYWADGKNEARVINLTRAREGFYLSDIIESKIAFVKRSAYKCPTIVRESTIDKSEAMEKDAFQFTLRYIYLDNEKSPLSPYSQIARTEAELEEYEITTDKGTRTAYRLMHAKSLTVSFEMTNDEVLIIKEVEILVRNTANENFSIVDSIKPVVGLNEYVFKDQKEGSLISQEEQAKLFDSVPRNPVSLASMKNKAFTLGGYDGYDDLGELTLSLSVVDYDGNGLFMKSGETYEVGVALYDVNMRTPGVVVSKTITLPKGTFGTGDVRATGSFINPKTIKANVTGRTPGWARYYQIVYKKGKDILVYSQVPVNVYFYVTDYQSTNPITGAVITNEPDADQLKFKNFIYLKDTPTVGFRQITDSYLHLQLPHNAPLTPDTDYKVRVLDGLSVETEAESVQEVRNGMMVTGRFGIIDSDFSSVMTSGTWIVDVYAENNQKSDLFYETGHVEKVTGGLFSVSHTLEGDTHRPSLTYWYDAIPANIVYTIKSTFIGLLESPTSAVDTVGSTELALGRKRGRSDNTNLDGIKIIKRNTGNTLDYNRIANNYGRPLLKLKENRELDLSSLVRFSNTFVQNSKINNLSSFDAANQHPISVDRGRGVKLVSTTNVLLVLHPQRVTSLYIGEGFIRQGEDAILAKTEGVIGDDRPQIAEHGTINPESVVTANGRVYFFDWIKREPCRYSNDGITPLATTYRMKKFFTDLCEKIEQEIGSGILSIVGGYDSKHDEYLMSFQGRSISTVTHYATIGFSERKKSFTSRYSYAPEAFAHSGDRLFSVKKSKLYEHYKGKYGEFDGTVHPSAVSYLSNSFPSVPKVYEAFSVEGSKPKSIVFTNKEGQETDILAEDFETMEGVHYASIFKDKNSQGLGEGAIPLLHGDDIRTQALNIAVELDNSTNEKQTLEYLNISYLPSTGHTTT